MGAQESELSLLDNPTGFLDHLESLNSRAPLSDIELQELVDLLTKEYHRADDLLRPEKFAHLIRPYNGRSRGLFRSVQFAQGVNVFEPYLGESYGRVQLEVAFGKPWGGQRATFHGSLQDRRQLTDFCIQDSINQHRGFVVAVDPPSLRPLGENEGF